MTIDSTTTINPTHPRYPIEQTVKSFMNSGKTISDLSFQSTTSTGVKGIHYLVKKKRYRVIWRRVYIAYIPDLKEATTVLKDYLTLVNQTDKYREDKAQVKQHLNHIKNTMLNKQ